MATRLTAKDRKTIRSALHFAIQDRHSMLACYRDPVTGKLMDDPYIEEVKEDIAKLERLLARLERG